MGFYRRRRAALFQLLLFAAPLLSNSSAATPASCEQRGDNGQVAVPLPRFMEKDSCLRKHTKPEDDRYIPVGLQLPMPLQLLRARNLLAAGHYEDALVDYKDGLPRWRVPLRYKAIAHREMAVAYEKVGRIDDAIAHAKLSGSSELLARLLLRKNSFAAAKAIADSRVSSSGACESELAQWLQFRALVECYLGQNDCAVRDLKAAALKYFLDDTEAANVCIRAANLLIEQFKIGKPFKLDASQLPSEGRGKVIELVKFLSRSANPLSVAELNRITGARIRLPGRVWSNIFHSDNGISPFTRLEYRSEHGNLSSPQLITLLISTEKCCVPKAEIDLLFPADASKVLAVNFWNGLDESDHAETWKLPTGQLFMRFGRGGARVLSSIEFHAFKADDKPTIEELKDRALGYWNDKEKELSTLSEAIELGDQMVDLYVERARVYREMGRFQEALVDAKQAVSLGGRLYLDQQATVEEQMGNLDNAIEDLRSLIGDRAPGPETTTWFTRLAELYVKNKQYRLALDACKKALVNSDEKADAMFIKAQAEAGLGNLDTARADAMFAASDYFGKAKIVLRDRVLKWVETLPSADQTVSQARFCPR